MPVPSSQRPSRRSPGRGSRSAQPNRRAPSRRQATRLRLLNGSPETGPDARARCGPAARSGRCRSSLGQFVDAPTPARTSPGASPGARIQAGVGTSSRTTRLAVWWASAAYITRAEPGGRLDELVDGRGDGSGRGAPARAAGRRRRRRAGPAGWWGCGSPMSENIWRRVRTTRTGRCEDGRGHRRRTTWCGAERPCCRSRRRRARSAPAPRPGRGRTAGELAARPTCAPWLESTTSSRPPSHAAVAACGSIGLLCSSGVVYSASTTHGGRGELGLHVALLRSRSGAAVDLRRGVQPGGRRAEGDVVRLLRRSVTDSASAASRACSEVSATTSATGQPAVRHPVVLETATVGSGCPSARQSASSRGGVAVVQDGEHAGHRRARPRLSTRADPAAGDGGRHQPAVGESGERDTPPRSGRRR